MALIMLVSFPTYAASGTKAALDAAATRPIELTDKDHQTLARVERYLTALTSVKADFIQVSPSGDIAGGQFYMMRPGKLRMQYDPPTPVLMGRIFRRDRHYLFRQRPHRRHPDQTQMAPMPVI